MITSAQPRPPERIAHTSEQLVDTLVQIGALILCTPMWCRGGSSSEGDVECLRAPTWVPRCSVLCDGAGTWRQQTSSKLPLPIEGPSHGDGPFQATERSTKRSGTTGAGLCAAWFPDGAPRRGPLQRRGQKKISQVQLPSERASERAREREREREEDWVHDRHLRFTLRYLIFTCTWCYATWSSLALDATQGGGG